MPLPREIFVTTSGDEGESRIIYCCIAYAPEESSIAMQWGGHPTKQDSVIIEQLARGLFAATRETMPEIPEEPQ